MSGGAFLPAPFGSDRIGLGQAGKSDRHRTAAQSGHSPEKTSVAGPVMKTGGRVVGPLQLEVAARQVGQDRPAGSAGQHAGDADRAGAGAAGQGDPRAALPGPHPHLAGAEHLDDVDVHPPGEGRVMLEHRARASRAGNAATSST